MEGVVGPAFAAVLESGRERFNARFLQARRTWPRLDGGVFLALLQSRIDPIVAAMSRRTEFHSVRARPEDANVSEGGRSGTPSYGSAANSVPANSVRPDGVEVLYDVALELLGKGIIGPNARHPQFEALWGDLMAATAPLLAQSPRELIGPLTNALYNLLQTPRCRAAEWVRIVAAVGDQCPDAEALRGAGQLAAWACGMAHYRSAALDLAAALPREVAARVLLPPGTSPESLTSVLVRLRTDPWYDPRGTRTATSLRIVAEVGGFRGLGGECLQPPVVAVHDDAIYISDGTSVWLLLADAFGAILHRVSEPLPKNRSNGHYVLKKDGTVQGPTSRAKFPLLAGASSSAATETMLAVTLPMSHRVFLVSEGGAGEGLA